MKKIVETIGPFQLMGSGAGDVDAVPFDRPAVVVATAYIQFKAAQGVLRIVADAPESATDASFAKFWEECDRDKDLAVAAFLASFEEHDDETAPG